ncbi:hypothetical protein HZC07_03995 [Candidatus Micrarchaeota archaeon]|nr:hypothetical protein [Candidatus Micrarchaeota archaeon]
MYKKSLGILLVLLAVAYSVAPAWVSEGVNINYTMGTDNVSFTVLNRTSTGINLAVKFASASKINRPTDNVSADSGQFWFDNSLLADAFIGRAIDEYIVVDESKKIFAGKEWDTVSLETTVSGAVTTKIFDRKTGLMLKQTVSGVDAPTVTLVAAYIPAFEPAKPPPAPPIIPPANPNTSNSSTNSTITPPPSPPSQNNTQQNTTNNTISQTPTQPPKNTPVTAPTGKKNLPCCPGVILLGLLGLVVIRKTRLF